MNSFLVGCYQYLPTSCYCLDTNNWALNARSKGFIKSNSTTDRCEATSLKWSVTTTIYMEVNEGIVIFNSIQRQLENEIEAWYGMTNNNCFSPSFFVVFGLHLCKKIRCGKMGNGYEVSFWCHNSTFLLLFYMHFFMNTWSKRFS